MYFKLVCDNWCNTNPDYVQGCNLIFLTCSVLVSALIGVCQMELIFCLTLKIYTILEYLPQTIIFVCPRVWSSVCWEHFLNINCRSSCCYVSNIIILRILTQTKEFPSSGSCQGFTTSQWFKRQSNKKLWYNGWFPWMSHSFVITCV